MIQQQDIAKIIDLTKEIKRLEAEKKTLTDALKIEMINSGQDTINFNGSKIQLIKYDKVSIKKNMKEPLLLYLKQNNLNSCIDISADVNKEILDTEINVGKITKQELSQYMNFTEVNSIKVTL